MPKSNNGNCDLLLPPAKLNETILICLNLAFLFGNSVIGGNCYKVPLKKRQHSRQR